MDPAEGSCCTLSVSLRDLQAPRIPMDRLRCAFCLGVFRDTVSGQRVYIDKGKFLSWLDAQTQMEKGDHYGW